MVKILCVTQSKTVFLQARYSLVTLQDNLRPSIAELAENPILKRKSVERLISYPSQ